MNSLQLFDNSAEKTTTLHVSHARACFLFVHVFARVYACTLGVSVVDQNLYKFLSARVLGFIVGLCLDE